jgi:hypothetical protein
MNMKCDISYEAVIDVINRKERLCETQKHW